MLKQRMWLCDECGEGRCITAVEDDVGEIDCVIDPKDCPFKSPQEVAQTGGSIADWREVEPVRYAEWRVVDDEVDVIGETLETEIEHGMEMEEGLKRLRNSCRLIIDSSIHLMDEDIVKSTAGSVLRALEGSDADICEDLTAMLIVVHDLANYMLRAHDHLEVTEESL